MSIKRIFFVFVLLALAGCSTPAAVSPTTQADPTEIPPVISVTDDLGSTIELDQPAQTIVSLSPSTTEMLFALGAGAQVVGREDNSTYPEAAVEVPSVGALFGELPTEAILALEPDLVVAGEIINAEQVQALRDLGLTVYWQANPTGFDALYENILDIGELTGRSEQAAALNEDLKARVAAVAETVASAEEKPTVFYEMDGTDPSNPWTTGAGTFIDVIITSAGGTNITADLEPYAQISTEDLIAKNPDVILLGDALYGMSPEIVAARPGWNVIKAVEQGAIYPIDPFMMSVPGPRLVDALEETARLIHPDLFE